MLRGVYCVLCMACLAALVAAAEQTVEVRGVVTDGARAIAGATVRVKATPNATTSDEQGRFLLRVPDKTWPVRVTAWKEGYYIAGSDAPKGAQDVRIALSPYVTSDCPDYEWPAYSPHSSGKENCGNCHGAIVKSWQTNAHAQSHRNPVFLSFYLGTDAQGQRGVGRGYRRDFPNTIGACAACHVPALALDAPWATDPSQVKDSETVGIHCQFCHLVTDVDLTDLGRRPGVLAMKFRRPSPQKNLFLGPFDDVDRGRASYVPLYAKSTFCAPCHEAEYWGTRVRSTFSEWQASPQAEEGTECQACHMPRGRGMTRMVDPGVKDAVDRDPATLAEHMTRENEERLLREAATLKVETSIAPGKLTVRVDVTNSLGGHHLPTGNARRNVVLLVSAMDAKGERLKQLSGERIPDWGGVGETDKGNYAGLAGKIYAKILEDEFECYPAPSWRRTRVLSDNRIIAGATDTESYTFELPLGANEAVVEAKLIHRRLLKPDMDRKGLAIPDRLMTSQRVAVRP